MKKLLLLILVFTLPLSSVFAGRTFNKKVVASKTFNKNVVASKTVQLDLSKKLSSLIKSRGINPKSRKAKFQLMRAIKKDPNLSKMLNNNLSNKINLQKVQNMLDRLEALGFLDPCTMGCMNCVGSHCPGC